MILGKKDLIDRLLIEKYCDIRTDNTVVSNEIKPISPDAYWNVMNFVALNNRFAIEVGGK